jgi:AsmA protein
MRILRSVLIGLGAVLLLAVAAAGVFLAVFDPNDYKPRIAAAAEQATGRELTLAGPIRLRPSLRPTLAVEDVAFANAEWGSRPAMARLGAMEVTLAVLPLIRGEVAIERIVLVEPDILLETDAEGRGNWAFAPRAAEPAAPAPGAPPAERQAPPQVAVDLLRIERGTVAFRDGRTGQTVTVAIPRLEASVPAGAPMRLDLEAVLDGTAVAVAGTAGPLARLLDPAARTPYPVDLTLRLADARVALKGTIAEPMTGKGYDLAVEAHVPDLARLAAAVPGAPPVPALRGLELAVSARDIGAPIPELRAITLKLGESDLAAIAPGVAVRRVEVSAPDTASPIRVAGEVVVNETPARLDGTLGPLAALMPGAGADRPWPVDVTLAAAGAQAAVKGQVLNLASPAPAADIALDLRVPDLAALSRLAGTALPPLKEVAASGRVRGPGNRGQVIVTDLALKAAGSDLGGTLTVTPAPRLRVEAALRGELVDADALMAALGPGEAPAGATAPPPAPSARPAQPAARQRLIPDDPLPLDALREADASVRLALAEFRFGGAAYREVAGTLALERGNLRLDPLNATVPGGAVTLRLAMDASKPEPPVRIALSAPSMELRQLLAAYGGGYRVGGQVQLDIDVRGTGATPHRIASTLDGHLGLAGANLDIDNRLIDLIAGEVWRAMVPGAPRDGVSNVRCLALRFDATDGVATARALLFDSNLARVAGTGSVNLGPETLALRLMPTLKIAGGGIGIPVTVGGTFLRPAIRPDAAGAAGALGQIGAGAAAGAQAGAVAGPLGAIVGGVVGAARGGATGDDCAAQLAIARGGRQGAVPAAETPAGQQPQEQPPQPAQPQAPTQQQRPSNPLQQLLPRLGR